MFLFHFSFPRMISMNFHLGGSNEGGLSLVVFDQFLKFLNLRIGNCCNQSFTCMSHFNFNFNGLESTFPAFLYFRISMESTFTWKEWGRAILSSFSVFPSYFVFCFSYFPCISYFSLTFTWEELGRAILSSFSVFPSYFVFYNSNFPCFSYFVFRISHWLSPGKSEGGLS